MSKSRYPVVIGLKLSTDLAADIRRLAREDDRTVSGYLRRVLAAVVRQARPGAFDTIPKPPNPTTTNKETNE